MKAVITGDIIHSTRMEEKKRIELLESLNTSLQLWSKDFDMRYEFYRGDSFQCLLLKPQQALRVALLIKTFIKSFGLDDYLIANKKQDVDARKKLDNIERVRNRILPNVKAFLNDSKIAIGIGETEDIGKKISMTSGEAFILSGRALDEYKAKQTFGIYTNDKYADELKTESILLDYILSKTTTAQSEVIMWKLLGYTENEISNTLQINQSAVNQRANAAGWFAIDNMVQRFENIYNHG